MADGSVAIALEGVNKRFGRHQAVRDVTIAIGDGEFFSLLGPSGCGKTTTLRMIAGFEVPDEGRIVLMGEDVTSVPANRRPLNMVFQQYALFPHMSIYDNVAFGLKVKRVPRAEHRDRVLEMLLRRSPVNWVRIVPGKGGAMKIGVLGSGMVGGAIASRLVGLGHEVTMGSRQAGNEKAKAWAETAGTGASEGSFADAAAFGELLFNCTSGMHSVAALESAGAEKLAGKVLVDVANALDFSGGMPPTLGVCNTDSLGEQIQRAFPETRVVKALNTMNAAVMVDPASVPGAHDVFVCGDDAAAKREVGGLLQSFGWPADRIRDLGGIVAARGPEMYVALWLALYGTFGNGAFNIAVVA